MSKKTFFIICSFLLVLPIMVQAGPEHDHGQKNVEKIDGKVTTLEGVLVCKNCSLKKDFGARSECKIRGCQHALKTTDGKFVEFLDNKYSQGLKDTKYAGKQIKVTGTFFANANTMDVQTITVEGKTVSWCDNCASMDGCSAK